MARDDLETTTVRLFIGVPMVPFFAKEIEAYLKPIKPKIQSLKWSTFESLHVTLHFFGDIEETQVQEISKVMRGVGERMTCLKLLLSQTDYFPDRSHPRVLWLGVGGEVDTLFELQTDVCHELKALNYPLEKRPFRPHATLARVRRLERFVQHEMVCFSEFPKTEVKEIPYFALYQRKGESDRVHYEIREKYEFRQK